jgi:hypothetical protein
MPFFCAVTFVLICYRAPYAKISSEFRFGNKENVDLSLITTPSGCISCSIKHQAMKANWGSGDTAPRIFKVGSRWRRMGSFTHRPLYPPGKRPRYPLDRRLCGPQRRSGRRGEENPPIRETKCISTVGRGSEMMGM